MDSASSFANTEPTRLRHVGPLADDPRPADESLEVASDERRAPDGGYGWVCTLSVFIINAHTWGINASWGIILAYCLSHQTFPGATHLQFAFIGGLSISQALMVGPAAMAVQRRFGLRTALLAGTGLMFAALFASAYATQVWHLFLSQGVGFGWGMGFLYTPASSALPPWFTSRRSLAVGISTAGAGFGGLVYSLATNAAVQRWGLPWAYRILALCSLGANLLSAGLLRDLAHKRRASQPPPSKFRMRDLGRIQVLLVVAWGITTELGYITLLYSLPHYAATIGLTARQGSLANALLNVGLALGRPVIGYASDIFGRINTAMIITATCALLCFALWIPANGFPLLAAFAFLVGGLCGIFWSTITPILVECVGLGQLSSTFGFVCTLMVFPTTFAEPIAMTLVGASGNIYLTAQVFVGCVFVVGASSLWVLRAWKIVGIRPKAEQVSESACTSWLQPPEVSHWPWLSALFSLDRV